MTVTLAFAFSNVSAKTNDFIPVKPKIVGGEQAQQGQWPWMSALVYTTDQISTSLIVAGQTYDTQLFSFSPSGNVQGELVDCGIGDQVCSAQNQICLIERGEINFSDKVKNCEAGGGVAAVVYNNIDGEINGTLGDDFDGNIPAVTITQQDGEILLTLLGEVAQVNVLIGAAVSQDSFCGASFIGSKWVLTAAHCVEDVNVNFLKVNVGEYNLANGAQDAIAAQRIYIHPDYANLNNDIALIELTQAVNQPAITLVSAQETEQLANDASAAIVMGWGGTVGYEPGGGPTSGEPNVLRQVELNLMTNQQCEDTLEASFANDGQPQNVTITNAMICAGIFSGGKSSCQGDSGGPLVVNTNSGWQQIGIVSWGFGCAEPGYPGAYTRAAIFEDWVNALSQGIAVEQTADFGVTPIGQTSSMTLTLTNNSAFDAVLSFDISGNDNFNILDEQCASLASGSVCQLTLTYLATVEETALAQLSISADNSQILTSSSLVKAQAISPSLNIENGLANENTRVSWFSGGDSHWQIDSANVGIASGNINNLQESIAMAVIDGTGKLTFEWSVSSEQNEDDPNDPFDALYLYVNNQQIEFISGEVAFTSYELDLGEGVNRVTWIYRKDPAASTGQDKGYIRNVNFESALPDIEPTPTPEPNPTPSDTPESSSGSSGGAINIIWLGLLILAIRQRYQLKFSA